jgi:phage FluMu protein Com
MPIEFRCTQCNRLLRTGDDAAGKEAKCPGCGQVLTVPVAAGAAAAGGIPPAPPVSVDIPTAAPGVPPSAGATPFGAPWPGAAPGGPQGPGGPRGPSGPVNPYQSPGDFAATPSWLPAVAPGAIVPTRVDLGDVFSRAWTVFKDQYGMCLGLYLATVGLSLLGNIVVNVVQALLRLASPDPMVVLVVTLVVTLVNFVFSIWITLGQVRGMISIARGQPTSIGLIFSGGPYLARAILGYLLLGLISLGIVLLAALVAVPVGFLAAQDDGRWIVAILGTIVLAVVPLTVVGLMFSQFQNLLVDRNVDVLESFSLSRQITSGNKLILFGSFLLIGLIGIGVALVTCGLGVLFGVAPYMVLLMAMFYLAMSGQTTADQLRYETWQNPPPMPAGPPPIPPAR